jgi:DNA polymerase-3 subunit gamma/tau
VEYLRILLLIKTGSEEAGEITEEDRRELKKLGENITSTRLLKSVKLFGQLDIGLDNYSTLPLELALVESTLLEAEVAQEKAPPPHPEPAAQKPAARPAPPATEKPVEKAGKPVKKTETAEVKAEKPETPPPLKAEVKAEAKAPPVTPPQKPPQPETTEENHSPLAAGSDIEQIRLNWSQMINDAPGGMSKTPVAALLRSARPVKLENNTIVVSFKYSYHKEKMDNLENQKTAEKIVSGFLGRACRVRCVYEHENNHLVKAALNMGAQYDNGEEA